MLISVPPIDFMVHIVNFWLPFPQHADSRCNVRILIRLHLWFPKGFGFNLDETWGKLAFWNWLVGFYLAFMPLYYLGLMGMPRRMQHYGNPEWQPFLVVAAVGALLIFIGINCLIIQWWSVSGNGMKIVMR